MHTTPQLLALLLSATFVACDRPAPGGDSAQAPPPLSATPAPSPDQSGQSAAAAVRQKGAAIATQAFGALSSRLGKAIADAGLTNAIAFCSVHGIALTQAVGVTNEVVLRRVTHQPRNPKNRADAGEVALIQQFRAELGKGSVPQPVVKEARAGYLTYYAPIVLNQPLCLGCHGKPGADIKSDVLAQIREIYPDDEATGFSIGQVRGLWSIDFKRSDFPPP